MRVCVCYKFGSFDCWGKTTQVHDDGIKENFQREKEKRHLKIVARPINYPNSNRIIYLRSELNVSRSVRGYIVDARCACLCVLMHNVHERMMSSIGIFKCNATHMWRQSQVYGFMLGCAIFMWLY